MRIRDVLDKLKDKNKPNPVPPENLEQHVRDALIKALTTETEQLVQALVKFGLTEEQANAIIAKAIAALTKEIVIPPTPTPST